MAQEKDAQIERLSEQVRQLQDELNGLKARLSVEVSKAVVSER